MAPTRSSESRASRRLAFLSTDSLDDFVCDDEVAIPALEASGWVVETVSWLDDAVRWGDYDLVIVRSPWDYQRDPERFLDVLREIDSSRSRLANPLAAMRWNLDKRYLLALADAGVAVVPTIAGERLDRRRLETLATETGWRELVVKPVVGANADHTYRLRWPAADRELDALLASHGDRAWLAQPFIDSIVEEGEYSLFYFADEFSHAILKTPAHGDFRVQEEHGGLIRSIGADEPLLAAGRRVMRALPAGLLYSRVDLARGAGGEWLLMEVEIVEPSLYFRMESGAPMRFATAVERWMATSAGSDDTP